MRRQRGAAEQADFENRRLREQIEKLQGDIEYRFNQLEGRGGAPAPGGDPVRPPPPRPAR
ncbi:hypothetical protein ACE7GA_01680 [Roseomonas sp. CCTCC AB2023176]|uniref:hypothetical protein n=1 Tax=Roseomonas sp. CCTCC AB2023176 TaxID=3342640 RepID=UPI0035DF5026